MGLAKIRLLYEQLIPPLTLSRLKSLSTRTLAALHHTFYYITVSF